MKKNSLKDGMFYLAKNGEIYKFKENNGNPVFRVDKHTVIGLDEFDDNLISRYPS